MSLSDEDFKAMLALAMPLAKAFITAPGRDNFSEQAYKDPGGVWTIGFGFTEAALGKPIAAGDRMSLLMANAILENIIEQVAERVWHYLVRGPDKYQFAAMISFAYNVGTGTFGQSRFLSEWNQGRPVQDVSDELLVYIHARSGQIEPGLVRRRRDEQTLFLQGQAKPGAKPGPEVLPKPGQGVASTYSADSTADELNAEVLSGTFKAGES